MRAIQPFEEYITEGIVTKQHPDRSRADHLKKEATETEAFLHQIIGSFGITDNNANTIIKLAYDVIMERIRAEMISKGYNAAGRGAHEAEVAYMRVLQFSEHDVQFCDQLRYLRNGIVYYGKSFDNEYAKKVVAFMKRVGR